jgi:hypothetical protein
MCFSVPLVRSRRNAAVNKAHPEQKDPLANQAKTAPPVLTAHLEHQVETCNLRLWNCCPCHHSARAKPNVVRLVPLVHPAPMEA